MFTKVIHLHLAKTAGTSINSWLDLLASAGRVRPADYDAQFRNRMRHKDRGPASADSNPDLLFADLGRESRAYWDIMHGHAESLVTKHPSTYRFVILRDPTSRLLSFLRDWRRCRASDVERLEGTHRELRSDAIACDASEFLARHAATPKFHLLSQASVLRGVAMAVLPATVLRPVLGSDLELARLALDRVFNYVGVFEDLSGAVRCIARDLGAAPPAGVGQANAGRAEPSRDTLTPAALRLLREAWGDDEPLHEHAGRLARGFAEPGYDEEDFERCGLQSRLQQLSPWYTGWGRAFSLNDQLVGSGFHGREAANTSGVLAWTGPGSRSVLYIPVPPDERIDLFLDVAAYQDPRVSESLRLRVDGRKTGFARRSAAGVAERIWIRTATSRPFVKLEILVRRGYASAELVPDSYDRRALGIAVRGYGYRIVSGADPGPEEWPGDALVSVASPEPVRDECHPDAEWALAFARRTLGRRPSQRSDKQVFAVVTGGLSGRALRSRVTVEGIEEAFQRVLRRPPAARVDRLLGREAVPHPPTAVHGADPRRGVPRPAEKAFVSGRAGSPTRSLRSLRGQRGARV
jgi:hypothetical protein